MADEPKEELIWDRRGTKRKHGTRSTARLLIFPFNHPASLARVRSALPSASLVPTDSSAGETSNTPRTALIYTGRRVRRPITTSLPCIKMSLCVRRGAEREDAALLLLGGGGVASRRHPHWPPHHCQHGWLPLRMVRPTTTAAHFIRVWWCTNIRPPTITHLHGPTALLSNDRAP